MNINITYNFVRVFALKKSIVNIIICLIFFCLAAIGLSNTLRYVSPEPYIPVLSDKMHYFQEHKNEFDVIFIGSSHIYRDINPIIFDTELSKYNFKYKSFNFGVSSMNLIEQRFLLKNILNEKPKNLKYVFVEPLLNLNLSSKNLGTTRVTYFSNWENTLFAIKYTLKSQIRLDSKINQISTFILAFMRHFFNVGSLSTSIFDATNSLKETGELKLSYFNQQGFFALDDEKDESLEQNRQNFLNTFDTYKYLLTQNYSVKKSRKRLLPLIQSNVLKEIQEDIKNTNAQVVFTITPGFTNINQASQTADTFHTKLGSFTLFNYYQSQGNDFKEIYQQQYWFDTFHLNRAGAKMFSARIAKDFTKFITNGIS